MRAGGVCGIDLGTTNSAVAIIVDGKATIVPDAQGRRTVPSVVTFLPNEGEVLVGHAARRRLTKDARNTFYSVKRFMGKRFEDKTVAEDARRVPYEVVRSEADDFRCNPGNLPPELCLDGCGPRGDGSGLAALYCPALNRRVMPEEASMHVLRHLLDLAEAALDDGPITRAVVTVPAYFDDDQRAATERAARAAGVETVKVLHEPVAAALAYGVDVEGDETVFVFDLGGGTFDVSVLDVGGGAVEVLATGGDAHLGGDDLDRAVAVWLSKEARALGAVVDPRGALVASRRAREALSDKMHVDIPMPGGVSKRLTRPLLEKVCADVLRRMRLPVENAADAAGINLEALQAAAAKKKGKGVVSRRGGRPFDHILLVGGATRTPAVRRFCENTFGRRPRPGLVNPDEVVALGAAVHAGALEGLLAEQEMLGPMQAGLIRAFAARMRREQGEEAFDAALGMDTASGGGEVWTEGAMAAAAAAAGLDVVEDEDEDDDWGPDDLRELTHDSSLNEEETEETEDGAEVEVRRDE